MKQQFNHIISLLALLAFSTCIFITITFLKINFCCHINAFLSFLLFSVLLVGKRDIIFLIDNTMGSHGIGAVREFIRRFVDSMPIGPDDVQVGVAQFSNVPRLEMDLNSHATKEAIVAALGGIKPRPGQTVNIGAALDFVRTNMMRPEKGSRLQQGVPQLLLLMTSKKSSDSVEEPAKAIQRMGILTLAAGSKAADEEELKKIAFADSVVFTLKDFRALTRNPKAILDALTTLAGIVVTEVPTEPGNNLSHSISSSMNKLLDL